MSPVSILVVVRKKEDVWLQSYEWHGSLRGAGSSEVARKVKIARRCVLAPSFCVSDRLDGVLCSCLDMEAKLQSWNDGKRYWQAHTSFGKCPLAPKSCTAAIALDPGSRFELWRPLHRPPNVVFGTDSIHSHVQSCSSYIHHLLQTLRTCQCSFQPPLQRFCDQTPCPLTGSLLLRLP